MCIHISPYNLYNTMCITAPINWHLIVQPLPNQIIYHDTTKKADTATCHFLKVHPIDFIWRSLITSYHLWRHNVVHHRLWKKMWVAATCHFLLPLSLTFFPSFFIFHPPKFATRRKKLQYNRKSRHYIPHVTFSPPPLSLSEGPSSPSHHTSPSLCLHSQN